ncbi:MAG: glycosyltransferase family 9 protein [bacterium]|nr:glycosyltransferase family 9 protein [bacterium]
MQEQSSKIKKYSKKAAIKTASLFWGNRERELLDNVDISSVLVVKMWAIGELVMATPAFAALREALPNAKITILTGRSAASIIKKSPCFDEVWIRPESVFLNKRITEMNRLRHRIKKRKFDVIISLHHSWEFSLFLATAGVKHRVGFARGDDGFAYTRKVPLVSGLHQVEEYFELIRPFGVDGEPGRLIMFASDRAEREAADIIRTIRPGPRGIAVVAPGGGVNPKTQMPQKRWPPEKYAELIERLNNDFAVILGGGPDDVELNGYIMSLNDTPVVNLANKPWEADIQTFYCVLKNASLFVGNDSAPMHLAAAANVPTVALFGPTDPAFNGPWRIPCTIVTQEMDCTPCYKDGYFPDCDHIRCLADITVEKVVEAVNALTK